MFEHSGQPLLPRRLFINRALRYFAASAGMIATSLGIGVIGYHLTEGLSWIDAVLNASMILTGMGPVDPMKTAGGKVFASIYALFSGVVFLSATALLFAPAFHRFIHRFHLDLEEGRKEED